MSKEEFKKLKIGDNVKLSKSLKDGYGEVWHESGEFLKIKSFTPDGEGVMFWSDLGTHYNNIEKINP